MLACACGSPPCAQTPAALEVAATQATQPSTVVVAAPSGPGVSDAPQRVNDVDARWAGTYDGTLESSGMQVAVTTRLDVADDGMVGSYVFEDPVMGAELGTLSDCHSPHERLLTCNWHDFYGTGELELRLTEDAQAFAGQWTSLGGDAWLSWNGARRSTGGLGLVGGSEEDAAAISDGE